ncbi:uncharacterized protein GGS22DRAFT_194613, partial [Annulohypoxylon maeteangense]|uniref:uncharacterized protein n=1 Tax=Annulohypoxylon maeteangense TaxID=1927788 RepID=UPI0020073FA2
HVEAGLLRSTIGAYIPTEGFFIFRGRKDGVSLCSFFFSSSSPRPLLLRPRISSLRICRIDRRFAFFIPSFMVPPARLEASLSGTWCASVSLARWANLLRFSVLSSSGSAHGSGNSCSSVGVSGCGVFIALVSFDLHAGYSLLRDLVKLRYGFR